MLWLPQAERARVQDQREAHAARVLDSVELKQQLDTWNRELRAIDPYLQLVKAKETIAPVPGLKPGYFHVIRNNVDAPPSIIPVQTPEGGFREPDSELFDMLRRSDCWSRELARDRRAMERRSEDAQRRRKAREREDRNEETLLRLKALEQPGVAFTDRPWTWRAGARKEKKAA